MSPDRHPAEEPLPGPAPVPARSTPREKRRPAADLVFPRRGGTSEEETADVGTLVAELARRFEAGGVASAAAEARDLVAAILEQPRFWPVAHADQPIDSETSARAREAAVLRLAGAPFAYAAHRAAFRHLTLVVDERVLIPRQETELLVDLVLATRRNRPGGVAADIGTGSGAIALSLASEGSFDRVIGTDISVDALAVARDNALRLARSVRTPLEFRAGSLLHALRGDTVDVLVANPPYIAFEEVPELPPSVRDWEPVAALLCGDRGMEITRGIVAAAPGHVREGGLLALEVDCRRAARVVELVVGTHAFDDIGVRRDLAGRERFVLATRNTTAAADPMCTTDLRHGTVHA